MENWNQLLSCVDKMSHYGDEYRYAQNVAVLSSKGNIYTVAIKNATDESLADEISFLEELKSNNDTEIRQILCKWHKGGFDVPSYAFRKLLIELNNANLNAIMLLQGDDTLIEKTVAQTMPK